MGMTDPVSDLLTRIRNATMVKLDTVEVPASNVKLHIVNILHQEGFIRNFKIVRDVTQDRICVYLKYVQGSCSVITGLQRVSRPGQRIYVRHKNLPRVRHGLGIAILSTSRGVMSDRQARALHLGGEHLCSVW